jgi:uncharacterized protein (DUF697 family)/GTP-binding protein EngB required for normal cell division
VAVGETRCNILMMGNSGAGKSTLVNVMSDDADKEKNKALVGHFGGRNTKRLSVHYNEEKKYALIDTKGLDLGFLSQQETINQVRKYIKKSIKSGDADAAIDVIWYCVDSQGERFYKQNVEQILSVYKYFRKVPVFIVLTKAYCSETARKQNENGIRNDLEKYDKKGKINLQGIISVNSTTFFTADDNAIDPFGIEELEIKTNDILPDAKKISEENLLRGKKNLKRRQANMTVTTCTTAAVSVGVLPLVIPDTMVLTPLQTVMIRAICKIYEINSKTSETIATAVFDATMVSKISKTVLSALKAIPVVNVIGGLLNGIVAGVITIAVGEATIVLCKKIDAGELSEIDVEGMKKLVMEQGIPELRKMLDQLQVAFSKTDVSKLNADRIKRFFTAIIKKYNTDDDSK